MAAMIKQWLQQQQQQKEKQQQVKRFYTCKTSSAQEQVIYQGSKSASKSLVLSNKTRLQIGKLMRTSEISSTMTNCFIECIPNITIICHPQNANSWEPWIKFRQHTCMHFMLHTEHIKKNRAFPASHETNLDCSHLPALHIRHQSVHDTSAHLCVRDNITSLTS